MDLAQLIRRHESDLRRQGVRAYGLGRRWSYKDWQEELRMSNAAWREAGADRQKG